MSYFFRQPASCLFCKATGVILLGSFVNKRRVKVRLASVEYVCDAGSDTFGYRGIINKELALNFMSECIR